LHTQRNLILVTLADINTALANEETVEGGVITLLNTLSAQLSTALAANDTASIQTVIDKINNDSQALAAAVAANTPATAPTSTPAPAPAPVAPAPAPSAPAASTDATDGDTSDESTDSESNSNNS
jgi:hypothetical protein